MAMAVAAITLTPKYRFYLSDTFGIPIMLAAGVFAFLMILSTGFSVPILLLLVAGGLTGFGYVKLLKAGYRPGTWMYDLSNKVEGLVTPDEKAIQRRRGNRRSQVMSHMGESNKVSAKRIDDILDKINQKGYKSLTTEEKDILIRAGKEEK
jgi:hypothetical protein